NSPGCGPTCAPNARCHQSNRRTPSTGSATTRSLPGGDEPGPAKGSTLPSAAPQCSYDKPACNRQDGADNREPDLGVQVAVILVTLRLVRIDLRVDGIDLRLNGVVRRLLLR